MKNIFKKKNNYEYFSLSKYLIRKVKKELNNKVCEVSDDITHEYPVKLIEINFQNLYSETYGPRIRGEINYIYNLGDSICKHSKDLFDDKYSFLHNCKNFLKKNKKIKLSLRRCISIFKYQYYIGISKMLHICHVSNYKISLGRDGIINETWMFSCEGMDKLYEINDKNINSKIIKRIKDIK